MLSSLFASDNTSGVAPRIIEAILKANQGFELAYGADSLTRKAHDAIEAFFETEISFYTTATGTAANALCVSALVPPYGNLLCHETAHLLNDECGAPEGLAAGAKILPVPTPGPKLRPDVLEAFYKDRALAGAGAPIRALSLSQATETGVVYAPEEVRDLTYFAHERGLPVHMDGARLANALAFLNCAPADVTWRAGVDVLSFGGTKNGCLMAEAVIFFNKDYAKDFAFRQRRAGQQVSKARFISAQFLAYLLNDYWLELARNANEMAQRLSKGLARRSDLYLAFPVQINEIFFFAPSEFSAALKARGHEAYVFPSSVYGEVSSQKHPGHALIRLTTSFAIQREDVTRFLEDVEKIPLKM